MENDANNLST